MDNPFKGGAFNLAEPEPIRTGDDERPRELMPYMDRKGWQQFSDDQVYQFDKRMREWLAGVSPEWRKRKHIYHERSYCFSEAFEAVMGREYTKEDGVYLQRKLSRVLAYYSQTVKPSHKMRDGRGWRQKKSYVFMLNPLERPAYSLRLRFEEFSEQGIMPNSENMATPIDDLDAGHSRNPNTEWIMWKRSEERRMALNEYQVRQRKKRNAARDRDGE